MASLFPDFEYDIFISYRQKDNKGDRWVSEFVNALKAELEATFKEDISIYFDENPHDGLLETHDVDASLKEKLKCLIFIPVISRTYCDPKSFAWEHEFRAFVDQAKSDRLGLKVTLPRGNVSSRILPVRIHDLDIADTKLCESVTGSVLRGVDFIYRAAGVNRPLRANEDHPQDNINRTYYRDQINKVANAIDEILMGLRNVGSVPAEESINTQKESQSIDGKPIERIKSLLSGKQKKWRLAVVIVIIICLTGTYITYKTLYLNKIEKTLAFIPLRISNSDTALKSDAEYFVEALNDKLNIVKRISIIPTISTLQFRNTEMPVDKIRKELKTNYLVDGNIRRDGKDIKIWIELSGAKSNKVLWSKTYDWNKSQVSQLTREIVQVIVSFLDIRLSPAENKQIVTDPSIYPDANVNYISANVTMKDALVFYNYGDKLLDSTSFSSAIEKYDKVIKEDSLFALAYSKRALAMAWGFFVGQLDSSYINRSKKDIDKALSLDKDLVETQIALGFYYYYCDIDFDKALFYFNKAAEMDPGNYQPVYYLSLVYRKMGKWKESQDLLHRVVRFNPQEALFLTNIGLSYEYLHKFDSALLYHQKAIDLVPGWSASYKNKIQTLLLRNGKTTEARTLLDAAIKNTGDNMIEDRITIDIYERKYAEAFKEAEKSNLSDFRDKGNKYILLALLSNLLNNPENGKIYYDSAVVILNKEVIKDPRKSATHSLLGIAYAGLGNKIKAVAEGEKAITLADKNKMDESDMKILFAQILTMVGDYDNAVPRIAYLLNNPSCFSESLLEVDPVWKPLMEKPEFKSKIRSYSKR